MFNQLVLIQGLLRVTLQEIQRMETNSDTNTVRETSALGVAARDVHRAFITFSQALEKRNASQNSL